MSGAAPASLSTPGDDLVLAIYDAALQPHTWPEITDRIRRSLGSEVAALAFVDHGNLTIDHSVTFLCNYPSWAMAAYADHFMAHDGRLQAVQPRPAAAVYVDDRDLDFADTEPSEIHQDFFRPIGVGHGIGMNLFSQPNRFGFLSAHRGLRHGSFRPAEIMLAERLTPHIIRAFQLQRQLARANQLAGGLAAGLDHFATAVFLLDARGCIRHCNAAAQALLARPLCPLQAKGGMLATSRPATTAALHHALLTAGASAAPPILRLPSPSGDLGLMVAPVRPSAGLAGVAEPLLLLFAADPARPHAPEATLLAAQFGLSPAEAAVAAALAEGLATEDIAGHRQVSRETIRSQAKTVLAKTGARTQAQLVGLVARSLAALRLPR